MSAPITSSDTKPPKQRGTGPVGKLRQVFETASKLPRRQQQRVIDVVEDILTADSTATA